MVCESAGVEMCGGLITQAGGTCCVAYPGGGHLPSPAAHPEPDDEMVPAVAGLAVGAQVWAFILMAVVGGYIGSVFTSFNTWICLIRKRWSGWISFRVLEVREGLGTHAESPWWG
jgi:hypothetical protein